MAKTRITQAGKSLNPKFKLPLSSDKSISKSSASIETTPFIIHDDAITPKLPDGDLWVFGYGSLMWRPDFNFLVESNATFHGYHRSLCVLSWVHRGTKEKPGLVLGLDKGGSCKGKAFKVCGSEKEKVAQYLYGRELATLAYLAKIVIIEIETPYSDRTQKVKALTFIVNRDNSQYTSGMTDQQLANIVSTASGVSGHSKDYLFSTLASLNELGIKETQLQNIASLVK